MIIIASKELDKHGVSHKSASQLVFQGRLFTKGQTFSSQLRAVAVEVAQENLSAGQPCILVEYDTHVTVWRSRRSLMGVSSHPERLG